MKPLISIIIPVYNVESYLDRCIQSLIDQTYRHIEIILINDGSTDGSGLICDNYTLKDNRIKVYHIENGGSSIARNYGLNKSQGDYIGFVDSDDWVKPNMYSEMLNFSIKNNLKVVECSSVELHLENHNNSETIEKISAKIEDRNSALKRIIKNKRFAVWRRLYQKSILEKRYFIEGILHQDVYYTIDILNDLDEIGFFENQYYVYNVQNPTSVIRSDYSIEKLNSINAGYYVVSQTNQYSDDIQDAAKQYLFEFLTHHYNELHLNEYLDNDLSHRKAIRQTLKKYHSIKNFDFYCFMIVILSPSLYKIFLYSNKKRINFQVKINQLFKNV